MIPAHLLQGAAAVVSKRDEDGDRPDWNPQRQFSVRENPIVRQLTVSGRARPIARPAPVKRSSTVPSVRSSPAHSRQGSRATSRTRDQSRTRTRRSDLQHETIERNARNLTKPADIDTKKAWRLSFTPGDGDELALSPRVLTPRSGSPVSFMADLEKQQHHRRNQSSGNPFADYADSRPSSFGGSQNPFLSRNNSTTSFYDEKSGSSTPEPEKAYTGGRPRKGTLEAVVDAVVPNALARKLTNSGRDSNLTRKSSMRAKLERAQVRGKEMQRNKGAMLAFEYGIYLLLICFIYFVLIGIPLWNGAVWWLYWVIANKFVIAGGFSITLGIAVL